MAEIRVHALAPLATFKPAEVDLDPAKWHWAHCLTFPLDTFSRLHSSQNSLKWIRYAIGVVLGANGNLSASSDHLAQTLDYNSDLPGETTDLYYHIENEEKQLMFIVDSNLSRTKVTSSIAAERDPDFLRQVRDRDGSCVVTGFGDLVCDAAHLISHSKGNEYIEFYTRYRSHGSVVIHDIDDVRNGLFLSKNLHAALGNDAIAFMMTPNFAMKTTDVDNSAQEDDVRCTLHTFGDEAAEESKIGVASGLSTRVYDGPSYPPGFLLDIVYAAAIVRHFGTPELKETSARFIAPLNPGTTSAQAELATIEANRKAAAEEKKDHDNARNVQHTRRGGEFLDVLWAFPYHLMSPEQVLETQELITKDAEEREATLNKQKIEAWLAQQTATV